MNTTSYTALLVPVSVISARRKGFTLIELLVTLAIIAVLLTIASPRYVGNIDKAKESVLKENLATLRDALDKFYADTGSYPDALQDLVTRRYMRRIPDDPLVENNTAWQLDAPTEGRGGKIYDVHSSAKGKGSDGRPYAEW